MKIKTSTFFYIFVILLVSGVYYFDYHKGEQEQKAKEVASVLLPFEKDIVKKVEFKSSSGEEISLEKNEKGWQLTKPLSDQADPNTMSDWLQQLTTEKSSESIGEGETINWDNYGLSAPKSKVTLFNYQSESTTVQIATRKNIDGNFFARRNQDNVVLVASSGFVSSLDKSVRDFRDKRVNRDGIGVIQTFRVKKDKNPLYFEVKEGLWHAPEKSSLKLSQNKVREVVNAINDMRASEFTLEQNPTAQEKIKFGLSKPSFSVEVTSKDYPVWQADFGQDKDKNWFVWIKDLKRVYRLEATYVEKIFKANLEDLKEPDPTPTPSPMGSPTPLPAEDAKK